MNKKVVFILIYGVVIYTLAFLGLYQPLIQLFTLFFSIAMCTFWMYQSRKKMDPSLKMVCFFIIASFCVGVMGGYYWHNHLTTYGTHPQVPNLANIFWIIQDFLYVVGLIILLKKFRSHRFIFSRDVLNVLTAIGIAYLLLWIFFIEPNISAISENIQPWQVITLFMVPFFDLAIYIGVLTLLFHFMGQLTKHKFVLFYIIGSIILITPDTYYTYMVMTNAREFSSLLDPLWILPGVFIGLAFTYTTNEIKDIKPTVDKRYRSILTNIPIFILLGYWVYQQESIAFIEVSIIGIISLIILKQWLVLGEIQTLLKKQKHLNEELKSIFNNDDTSIFIYDMVNKKTEYTAGIEKIYKLKKEELKDSLKFWYEFVHGDDKKMFAGFFNSAGDGKYSVGEFRMFRTDGEMRWLEIRITPIRKANNEVSKLYGVVIDITERKLAEEKSKYLAYHDALTGLPNRFKFYENLSLAVERCKKNNKELAVMFIDLDRFKFINDTLGHEAGDIVLKEVAKRLKDKIGKNGTVARQSGDEFIILLENTNIVKIEVIAKSILQAFTVPFSLHGKDIYTSPSIGISRYPYNALEGKTLIKQADDAMYVAKSKGKNGFQFFVNYDDDKIHRRILLEQGLRKAIELNQLLLYYQPQVNLKTGEIVGVEALLRWEHPELGLISPMEFIPLAEETGLIIPIGNWVVQKACEQASAWEKSGLPIKVAVNVSPIQFEDKSFIENIEKALHDNTLSPHYVEIEITEGIMQKVECSIEILNKLKELGVKISLDDFGTGYSSLSVLSLLPIHYLKIDKSFVNGISFNSKTASVIKTIIEMGINLHFEIIAEGIEDRKQAEFLNKYGCQYGQGYLFYQPLPLNELETLLRKKDIC